MCRSALYLLIAQSGCGNASVRKNQRMVDFHEERKITDTSHGMQTRVTNFGKKDKT